MKTVIIWDTLEGQIKFYVLDGDYRHLSDVYINSTDSDDNLQRELSSLIYDQNCGKELHPSSTEFPVEAVKEGASVIIAGFLP